MARPTLIVYCGLPGVGKSVASAYTAEQLGAERYRSDRVRKRLFPDPDYTSEETDATYTELLGLAREDLSAGTDVVLDATFQSKPYRDRAGEIADAVGADCTFVHVDCDLSVVKDRIESRTDSVSDARFEQYLQLRETFDPLDCDHLTIDNSGSLEDTYTQIDRALLAPVATQ
ncbi:AAA family ATPase [Natronococcus occultus]|uniref:Putative kinase n=1 Tax=Natronococcus occultus SP4 TaxID=694430 RepID=L0K2I0_9EURY|nr:AAA family ATPase [Natronococcus occultus]AGB38288.1 putative kinase [Natronococcus occultus SP4]